MIKIPTRQVMVIILLVVGSDTGAAWSRGMCEPACCVRKLPHSVLVLEWRKQGVENGEMLLPNYLNATFCLSPMAPL